MTFGRHDSFYIRDGWINKILDGITKKSDIFQSKDAPEILGVGYNMVKSMKFWAEAMGLVKFHRSDNLKHKITVLGRKIKENDPYLEKIESLWLLHINLASSLAYSSTWYYFFNLYDSAIFDVTDFNRLISPWIEDNYKEIQTKSKVSENTLKKDIMCFINTYTMKRKKQNPESEIFSPLSQLNLMNYQSQRILFNSLNQKQVPITIFEYALLNYMLKIESTEDNDIIQVNVIDLIDQPLSPGRILKCSTNALYGLISAAINRGFIKGLKLERTAGLDVVTISKQNKVQDILGLIYEG